jgi:hypothetical protein
MGLGPATGRSSVLFGLRHGTISGPTTRPHKSGGRTRAASSRARETAAAAAGTRGKREARRKERGRADRRHLRGWLAGKLGKSGEVGHAMRARGRRGVARSSRRATSSHERARSQGAASGQPASSCRGPAARMVEQAAFPRERVGGRAGEQTLR